MTFVGINQNHVVFFQLIDTASGADVRSAAQNDEKFDFIVPIIMEGSERINVFPQEQFLCVVSVLEEILWRFHRRPAPFYCLGCFFFSGVILDNAHTTSQWALWGNISTGVKPSAR